MSRRDMVVAPISVRTTLNRPPILPAASATSALFRLAAEIGVLGKAGDHRHEVGLTGAVVADDQQALVVGGLVELELGNDQTHQLLRHLLGNDVGLDKLPGRSRFVGVPQLDHGLDGLELDQVSVFHRICSLAMEFVVFMSSPPGLPPENHVSDIVCTPGDPELHRSKNRQRWCRSRPRPRSCCARAPGAAEAGPVSGQHRR